MGAEGTRGVCVWVWVFVFGNGEIERECVDRDGRGERRWRGGWRRGRGCVWLTDWVGNGRESERLVALQSRSTQGGVRVSVNVCWGEGPGCVTVQHASGSKCLRAPLGRVRPRRNPRLEQRRRGRSGLGERGLADIWRPLSWLELGVASFSPPPTLPAFLPSPASGAGRSCSPGGITAGITPRFLGDPPRSLIQPREEIRAGRGECGWLWGKHAVTPLSN